jgi:predicted nucleic acid-binding protein
LIYLDTSVALAHLLAEDRRPPDSLWDEDLIISSRLLEYEAWTVLHGRRLARSHGDSLRVVLTRVSILELDPAVVARALEPFPVPLRTLDALHLASVVYLLEAGQAPKLATYDERMATAARKLKIPLRAL